MISDQSLLLRTIVLNDVSLKFDKRKFIIVFYPI